MIVIFVLIILASGAASELITKNSSNKIKYYSLKMPICYSIFVTPILIAGRFLSESGLDIFSLIASNRLIAYTYMFFGLSVLIAIFGVKYMEISLYSSLSNLGGAVAIVILLIYLFLNNKTNLLSNYLSPAVVAGIILSSMGLLFLAILQNKYANEERKQLTADQKKYRYGAWAFIFPLALCLSDGFSTFVDSIVLGASGENGFGAMDYLRIVSFSGVILGVISWVILSVKNKKVYVPFGKETRPIYLKAVFDTLDTGAYFLALESNALLAITAEYTYTVITIILSRIILKEKLTKAQYILVAVVMLGVFLIG